MTRHYLACQNWQGSIQWDPKPQIDIAMEAQRTPPPLRRVGVVMAGIGGVGEAFVRVLQQRFQTAQLEVVLVAIGDSSGFLSPSASEPEAFKWDDVDAILAHKAGGQAIRLWRTEGSSVIELDTLPAALEHVHGRRGLADYVVADCTSSAATTPSLIKAKELGFAVILANKLPVAGPLENYKRLVGDPSKPSPRVRYEATVGAGIPVVDVLQRIIASKDLVKRIQGGLSGTMTYILAAMNRGTKFSTALLEVKQLGITEADPRQDLSGADVARKMVILARELGIEVETSDVEISPLLPAAAFSLPVDAFLDSLHEYDAEFDARLQDAKAEGLTLAYIGSIHHDGKIHIGLEHVQPHSLFATASSTEGVIAIQSEWFPEPLTLRGTGAGAASTAAAVAGDLASIIHFRI